jgi:dTDP-4-dehydrorhamnose reductase
METFNENIVVLGDGLLGSEICKQTGWDNISRRKNMFDITVAPQNPNWEYPLSRYDTIINCIAHTDSYSNDREKHWNVNYKGVHNLVEFCNKHNIKLVHIGTDYMFANNKNKNVTEEDVPVHSEHWYSYTKLLADGLVQLLSKNYLICRCTHKPYPFPYDTAFIDRVGNFDYVHKIAELIIKLVKADENGVYNVGTKKKSVYELVWPDNHRIKKSLTPIGYPLDTSMSIEKLNNFLK